MDHLLRVSRAVCLVSVSLARAPLFLFRDRKMKMGSIGRRGR